ncbi:hypothetical protein SD37_39810 [Amycolatopsis orientalis]|uniref:Uncharacterized protein n=1 Tax=Amycolatopsis orientalis TaxID=31958 RepID=A0A193C9K9_AMYOR|nr:hypothetical protein [Amycolatopsis orientalis]ANN21134.1 hypothetical protein SD37_39810 [Amycolatopsis orientalis]
MVTSDEEIARRLEERDSARSARRKQAAAVVGELARRHTELAEQLADLERELGEVLTAAGDVIGVPELADVTDIPAADLTRWRDQATKPARGGKRKRPGAAKNNGIPSKDTPTATVPRAGQPAAPASSAPAAGSRAEAAVGAASS